MGKTLDFPFAKSKVDLVHQMKRISNKRCCHKTIGVGRHPCDHQAKTSYGLFRHVVRLQPEVPVTSVLSGRCAANDDINVAGVAHVVDIASAGLGILNLPSGAMLYDDDDVSLCDTTNVASVHNT